jgi:Ca-activated chloride channel family protein
VSPASAFARPEWWPLLLLPPLAWLGLFLRDRARARRAAALAGRRPGLLVGVPSERARAASRLLAAAGLLAAVVAVLEPLGTGTEEAIEAPGADVVVCLDVSRSMLAGDERPDRLTAAKRLIGGLAARGRGDRLGLVTFAGEARLAVPLTTDAASFADLVDLADPGDMAKGGTDLGAALDAALAALDGARAGGGTVVLVTDGEDHEGRGLEAARRCRERGVVVHAVGLGTDAGGKIAAEGAGARPFLVDPRSGAEVVSRRDARGLARIAAETGGAYLEGAASDRLGALVDERASPATRAAPGAAGRRPTRYQAPLAAAVLLFALDLALARRRRR